MTEQEWLECGEPGKMLRLIGDHQSDRKLRLFTVACCRRQWDLITNGISRYAIALGEKMIEGLAGQADFIEARPQLLQAARAGSAAAELALRLCSKDHLGGSHIAWTVTGPWLQHLKSDEEHRKEVAAQARLLREIFGNPFRPITAEPSWLTSTVVSVATSIYDERAFDRLPILADALEDAGCANADILNHCRQLGEHVRGCWPVDLLWGKQ